MKRSLLIALSVLSLGACSQEPVGVRSYGVNDGAGSTGIHTVLRGDTVYKIAQNYQLPMREIIALNNLNAPYNLQTGYRIKLPPPNEYRVRAGDNISSVARLYEVSPNRLANLNGLRPPYNLQANQMLRLPTPSSLNKVASRGASKVVKNNSIERQVLAPKIPSKTTTVVLTDGDSGMVTPPHKPQVVKTKVASGKLSQKIPRLSRTGDFMRPINGKIISSYGPKKNGLHNDGINIRGVRGTPVRAAENGVVVYNGSDLAGYGNLILVRHENKLMSAYAHLDKTLVKRGAKIKRGQAIGTVGSSGQVETPQLHFEIRKGSTPLNPEKYL